MSYTEKEWYIGIDFGTSNTCVIAYEATKGIIYRDNMWGEGIHDRHFNIPTLITRDAWFTTEEQKGNEENADASDYIGVEAELHPVLRPFKGLKAAAREITPNNGLFGKNAIEYPFDECGLDSKLEMGTTDNPLPVEVRALVVQFLKRVLHVGDDKFGINEGTVKKIVIGCPAIKKSNYASCKVSYEDTLKGLLAECFTGDRADKKFIGNNVDDGIITVVPEPALAGVTYLFSDSKREDIKVLVIDIGGGTSDFSVLEYKNGKVEPVNIGSCEIAGDAIDKLIFDLLPDEIPHFKTKCRKWKENLFASESDEGSIAIINPISTQKLSRTITEQKINGKDFFLYYNNPSDSIVQNGIAIGDKIETEVFDKIAEALDTALNANGITGINTIFFIGGTSIITPLREKIVDKVADHRKHYCVSDFNIDKNVVDMFGDKTPKIEADGSGPIPVTCYNAVAIGACISAMTQGNEKLICVKPSLIFNIDGAEGEKQFKTTNNNLIIKTKKGTPFAWIYFEETELSEFKYESKYYAPGLHFYVKINDQDDCCKYAIELDQYKDSKQLAIVAMHCTDGIQFKAYGIDNQLVKDMKLENIINQHEITIKKETR